MVVNKRKKASRSRGLHTHFYGSKKKHRGAGHRGGRGNAGSGKKADQKKPSHWKDPKYFGHYGFTSKNRLHVDAISLKDLALELPNLITKGVAMNDAGKVRLDLEKTGYNKVLSNGEAPKNLILITPYASARAVQKIKQAGGSVEGLREKKQKKSAGGTRAPEKPKEA